MPTKKIRDLDPEETCMNPEHNPPSHMIYGEGIWEHTCPGCGRSVTFTIRNPQWCGGANSLSWFTAVKPQRQMKSYEDGPWVQ